MSAWSSPTVDPYVIFRRRRRGALAPRRTAESRRFSNLRPSFGGSTFAGLRSIFSRPRDAEATETRLALDGTGPRSALLDRRDVRLITQLNLSQHARRTGSVGFKSLPVCSIEVPNHRHCWLNFIEQFVYPNLAAQRPVPAQLVSMPQEADETGRSGRRNILRGRQDIEISSACPLPGVAGRHVQQRRRRHQEATRPPMEDASEHGNSCYLAGSQIHVGRNWILDQVIFGEQPHDMALANQPDRSRSRRLRGRRPPESLLFDENAGISSEYLFLPDGRSSSRRLRRDRNPTSSASATGTVLDDAFSTCRRRARCPRPASLTRRAPLFRNLSHFSVPSATVSRSAYRKASPMRCAVHASTKRFTALRKIVIRE